MSSFPYFEMWKNYKKMEILTQIDLLAGQQLLLTESLPDSLGYI